MEHEALRRLQCCVRECGWATVETNGSDQALLLVANAFGTPVPSRPNVPLISRLAPTASKAARPGTMSSIFGLGEFPLHTDTAHWPTPARYVVLRSAGMRHDRPTLLASSESLRKSQKHGLLVRRSVWTAKGPIGLFYCSMIFSAVGESGVRLDLCCMRPYNHSARIVLDSMAELLPVKERIEVGWRPNLTLVVDNWRMLHGRGSALGSDEGERIIERVLVMA